MPKLIPTFKKTLSAIKAPFVALKRKLSRTTVVPVEEPQVRYPCELKKSKHVQRRKFPDEEQPARTVINQEVVVPQLPVPEPKTFVYLGPKKRISPRIAELIELLRKNKLELAREIVEPKMYVGPSKRISPKIATIIQQLERRGDEKLVQEKSIVEREYEDYELDEFFKWAEIPMLQLDTFFNDEIEDNEECVDHCNDESKKTLERCCSFDTMTVMKRGSQFAISCPTMLTA